MEIKICDWCKKMIEGNKGRRVPAIDPDEERYWDLDLDCVPRYNEYRRAAQEIVDRHEKEQREELRKLEEEVVRGPEA